MTYKIDTDLNSIVPLPSGTFNPRFKERANLQEWIAKEPSCLGENLLVIQKEFAGFSYTNERLDLLALDKKGSLVLIENKLDDTGRDVTWQALKYASYCSTLLKEDVRKIYQQYLDKTPQTLPSADAKARITAFLEEDEYEQVAINEGFNPRIILVAANFRKEVTSTVFWLLRFKLRVQCIRVILYSTGDQYFLNFEPVIPTAEEGGLNDETGKRPTRPLNYVPPKLDYDDMMQKCSEENGKIVVGFLHGLNELQQTPLETLRPKLYKWDSFDTPTLGSKIPGNWIKGDVFWRACRQKEQKEASETQPESASPVS
jgi:hypothetical protein